LALGESVKTATAAKVLTSRDRGERIPHSMVGGCNLKATPPSWRIQPVMRTNVKLIMPRCPGHPFPMTPLEDHQVKASKLAISDSFP